MMLGNLVVLLVNCVQVESRDRVFKNFDQELVSHFPRNEKGMIYWSTFYPSANSGFSDMMNAGAFTKHTYQFTQEEISETILALGLDTIPRIIHSDVRCIECQNDDNKESSIKCLGERGPIPTFYHERQNLKIESKFLSDDFVLYLIDAKEGIYLPEYALIKDKCPIERWAHGYSRGIAISNERKLAIFWLEIW